MKITSIVLTAIQKVSIIEHIIVTTSVYVWKTVANRALGHYVGMLVSVTYLS